MLKVCLVSILFACTSIYAQSANPLELAPGVVLPDNDDATVLALDNPSGGMTLVHIKPHETSFVSHAGSNFLRSMVYSGPHATIEIDDPHADTSVSDKTTFFVRLSADSSEIDQQRVRMLWLEAGKKRRQIADFSTNVFGGQHSRAVNEVPCEAVRISGTRWLKLTPKDPLLPGDFAIVFLPKDVNKMPDMAYDFRVAGDPSGKASPYRTNTGQPSANSK